MEDGDGGSLCPEDGDFMDAKPDVNQWLWRFARGKPRLGGLSVEETDDRKDAAQKVRVEPQLERRAETRRRRKADRA